MLYITVKVISIAVAAAAASVAGGAVVQQQQQQQQTIIGCFSPSIMQSSGPQSTSSTRHSSTALFHSSHNHRLVGPSTKRIHAFSVSRRRHPDLLELRTNTMPSCPAFYRTCTQLHTSPLMIQTNVVERWELTKQFERWRFMQKLLEGEVLPSDIEDVLILVLHAYLQHGPSAGVSSSNQNENGGIASPVLTPYQRIAVQDVIESMISASDGIGDSRILHMLVLPPAADWDSVNIDCAGEMVEVDSNALSMLQKIEHILPDPNEDEESHKGAWDVIVELHGRESVRVEEEKLQRENNDLNVESTTNGSNIHVKYCRAQSLHWRTLSTIGRVLIHFDFLTKGVLKEGTFSVD